MAVFQLLGRRPLFHVELKNSRMTFLPGSPRWISISLCILSGPGDLRVLSFLRAFLNSDIVSSSSNSLILAVGEVSSALRSWMRRTSLSFNFSALEIDAKYLLCRFALFWSSTIGSFSEFRGFGLLFLCSPVRF